MLGTTSKGAEHLLGVRFLLTQLERGAVPLALRVGYVCIIA